MKDMYVTAEIRIVEFETEDVITTSDIETTTATTSIGIPAGGSGDGDIGAGNW